MGLLRWTSMLMIACGAVFSLGCEGRGTMLEFNKGEVYYKGTVTEEEAKKLGDFLVEDGTFDGTPKTVQLDKNGETYLVRFVMIAGAEQDEDSIENMKIVGWRISDEVFDGKPVKVHMCDPYLKTLKEIEPIAGWGTLLEFNAGELYYTDKVNEDDARKVGEKLEDIKFFDGKRKTVQLDKDGDDYVLRYVVKEGMEDNELHILGMKTIGKTIADEALDGATLEIQMCDKFLRPIKTLE